MIQEIKDRVPVNVLSNDAIRYGIYDEQGNLVRYEYIKREDEPVEVGTSINKALFSNLQGDLYTADRYNKLNVIRKSIGQGEVAKTGNIFPAVWKVVTEGTKYNSDDGYILEASSVTTGDSYAVRSACDDIDSTNWGSAKELNKWIKMTLPQDTKITKMKIYVSSSTTAGMTTRIEGSKDDSYWVTLHTFSGKADEEVALNNADYYKYYRIYISHTSANTAVVYEWRTSEYIVSEEQYNYFANLSMPLTSYEVGKIANIEVNKYLLNGQNYQEKDFTSNIIPVFIRAKDAENEYGIWHLQANTSEHGGAYNVFDNNDSTYWGFPKNTDIYSLELFANTSGERWQIKPSKVTIKSFACANVKLYGSNDGINWTLITSFEDSNTNNTSTKEITNSKYYSYFKLEGSSYPDTYYGKIYTMEIISGSIRYGILEDEYMTSFENLYLNINNLGAKQINGIIEAGQKYSLIYNGESWDIQKTKVVTGSFATAQYTTYNIDLGFTPDIVIIYSSKTYENSFAYGTASVSWQPRNNQVILTKAYSNDLTGKITTNGFLKQTSNDAGVSILYYIAIKF